MRCLWIVPLLCLTAGAQPIGIDDPKASFEVPEGWTPVRNDTAGVGWKFEKKPEGPCGIPIRLFVYVEHEEAKKPGRDPFPVLKDWPRELPRQVPWKEFSVPVTYRLEGADDAQRLKLLVDVPVWRHALRVEMTTSVTRVEEAATDMARIVGSIQAESSWRTESGQHAYLAGSLIWVPGYLLALSYFLTWLFRWYGHPDASPRTRLYWSGAASLMLFVGILLSPIPKEGDKEPPSRLKDPRLHMALVLLVAALDKVVRLSPRRT